MNTRDLDEWITGRWGDAYWDGDPRPRDTQVDAQLELRRIARLPVSEQAAALRAIGKSDAYVRGWFQVRR